MGGATGQDTMEIEPEQATKHLLSQHCCQQLSLKWKSIDLCRTGWIGRDVLFTH